MKNIRIICGVPTSVASLETAIKPGTRPPCCYCIHLQTITTTNIYILPKGMKRTSFVSLQLVARVSFETQPRPPPCFYSLQELKHTGFRGSAMKQRSPEFHLNRLSAFKIQMGKTQTDSMVTPRACWFSFPNRKMKVATRRPCTEVHSMEMTDKLHR